jgi:hypothetical protein
VGTSDGTVELYNPDTRQITPVAGHLTTFRSGVAANNLDTLASALKMNWDGRSDLKLSGTAGDFTIAPGTRKVITGDNGAQFVVDYGANGQVVFTAVSSAFTMQITPLKDWQVNLGEGDGVILQQDLGSGVVYGTANANNAGPVTFITPEGRPVAVSAGGVITVIGGQQGSLLSRTEGSVVFYEGGNSGLTSGQPTPTASPAGSASFGRSSGNAFGASAAATPLPPAGTTPISFGRVPTQVDPSRLSQPPVSVVGSR